MAQLNIETVARVAKLARLSLDDDEIRSMQMELSKILEHVDQLSAIDTEGIEPLAHAADVYDRVRQDVGTPSLDRSDALRNAPDTDGEHFLVPPVFGADDSPG